jgi:hypothetical protein
MTDKAGEMADDGIDSVQDKVSGMMDDQKG